jgi:PAS domain S-box-containing protein
MPSPEVPERFEALFNHASLGIILADGDGRIIIINNFALKLFGYTREEVEGSPVELLIPTRFRHRHVEHRTGYATHPKSRPMGIGMDLFAVKKDGSEFPVEVSLGHYHENGKPFVLAFVNDITARKKIEAEIMALNTKLEEKIQERTSVLEQTVTRLNEQVAKTEAKDKALQELNIFLNSILTHAGAMIVATRPDGLITLFNQAAERTLGYAAGEVVGHFDPTLFHCPDETRQRAELFSKELDIAVPAGFETYVARARRNLVNEYEWQYVRKDGSRLPVLLSVTAIRNGDDAISGFLGIAIDITERKRIHENLERAYLKEKELGELKSRFVSIASHEFRTPLSTVLSSTYLLSKYTTTEEQPKREKHIERIVSSVNLLNDILNDFLSVGKIEEGKVAPRYTRINIRDFVGEITSELSVTLKEGQVIEYGHEGAAEVETDGTLLKHILLNLLSNAIKFSGPSTTVSIHTQNTGTKYYLSVKDQGIGIPQAEQEYLFGRFFRAHNAMNIQGTGLGLHIVARYVELLGGVITCTSSEGEGTLFEIHFNHQNRHHEKNITD